MSENAENNKKHTWTVLDAITPSLLLYESNSIANPITSYRNHMFNHVKKLCHKFLQQENQP